MKLSEISKQEFVDRLNDPRHKQVRQRLEQLDTVFDEWGWEIEWKQDTTQPNFLTYDVLATAGMTAEQIHKREKFQVTAHKIRLAIKNMFWEAGPNEYREIPDIVVREADFTPMRVEMWIMHDEEAEV